MATRTIAICLLLALFNSPLRACEQASSTCTEADRWQFSLAMGAGFRSNPLHGGHNWPLWLMPDLSYYGQQWFFDNGTLGYTLDPNAGWQFSLVSRLNEEAGYFRRASPANVFQRQGIASITGPQEKFLSASHKSVAELANRPLALDGGAQLDWNWAGLQWRFNWWHDISGQYHGQHLKFGAAYALTHHTGNWLLSSAIAWKDKNLMNTYYGIRAFEGDGFDYQAKANWQPELAIQWQYPLNEQWSLLSMLRYRWLDTKVQLNPAGPTTPSPMMKEQHIRSWFVGLSYRFF